MVEHVKAPAAEARAERLGAIASFGAILDQAETKIHPDYGQIQDLLRTALKGDAIIVNDMTGICYKMSRSNFPMWEPGSFLFPRGYGTLGWAMPAALGAKLSSPERATAALYQVPLPIIIVNNESYDEIRLAFNADPQGTAYVCDLVQAITEALAADGPTIIEIPVAKVPPR